MEKFDWSLFFSVLFLSLLGIFLLFLIRDDLAKKQLFFLFLGVTFCFLFFFVDIEALKQSKIFIFLVYLFSLFLLSLLFFLAPEIRGARCWFKLGNFTFQPVEFTKIVLVLFFAKFFSSRHRELYHFWQIFLSLIYLSLPSLLVFFQPDFGSFLVLCFLWFSMILIAGIKRKHFLLIVSVAILLGVLSWLFLLKPYQKERIIAFLHPYLFARTSGYHILQSLNAIGSGGIFGKGPFFPYLLSKMGFLPEAHTDFMFATFCEMFGFVGGLFLLFFYLFFFWRIFEISKKAKTNFSKLICSGFGSYLAFQTFLNMAMNLGLLPITGVPLPFLSYGGSSLIFNFIGLGIIESIKRYQTKEVLYKERSKKIL